MEDVRFDRLVRTVAGLTSRRSVLGLVASLPVVGAGFSLLDPDKAEGRKRRNHRRDRRKHDLDAEKKKKKKQKKSKKKKHLRRACAPDAIATTCAGKCGGVTDNCGQTVACGSCTCTPACDECFVCQGTPGGCVAAARGVACGAAATCENGTIHHQGTCNGSGSCQPGAAESCAPYAGCDGAACATSCIDNQGCMPGSFCEAGQCAGDRLNSEPCSQGGQCQSGVCAQGVCCDRACDGDCEACDLTGTKGACSPKDDGATCGGDVCCGGVCKECCADAQCPDTAPFCRGNTCQPCMSYSLDCPGATCCDPASGACVETCPGSDAVCYPDKSCRAACHSHADCAWISSNSICVDEVCHRCDAHGGVNQPVDLQEALDTAPSGKTIYVCPGIYHRTREQYIIVGNSIVGAGDGAEGTSVDRVKVIGGSTTPTITLRDVGIRTDERGVWNQYGSLAMQGCTVSGEGIGVFNDQGVLVMTSCKVAGNTSDGISNNFGLVTLRDSLVQENSPGIRSVNGNLPWLPVASLALHNTRVMGNSSATAGAGILNISNGSSYGLVTLADGSLVCGNTPAETQCDGFDSSDCALTCPA